MTNVTYDSQNNIPNEILSNFAHTLGWKTPSAIETEGFSRVYSKKRKTGICWRSTN